MSSLYIIPLSVFVDMAIDDKFNTTHRQRELISNIKQSQAHPLTDQYIIELALDLYYQLENPQEILD